LPNTQPSSRSEQAGIAEHTTQQQEWAG
jgi:hypothetical protein